MFVSLSRPTASKFARIFGCIAASLTLFGVSAPSALAAEGGACEGQGFSQPFAALGDLNTYTLVPGGEFNSASEGWELSGGAQIIQTTLPSGRLSSLMPQRFSWRQSNMWEQEVASWVDIVSGFSPARIHNSQCFTFNMAVIF